MNASQAWLHKALTEQMRAELVAAIRAKLPKLPELSFDPHEVEDIVDDFLMRGIILRDPVGRRGKEPTSSDLKQWVWLHALTWLRDRASDVHNRVHMGVRLPPGAMREVLPPSSDTWYEEGETDDVVLPHRIMSRDPGMDEVLDCAAHLLWAEDVLRESDHPQVERLLRVFRLVLNGLDITSIAREVGCSRNRTGMLVTQVRSIITDALPRENVPTRVLRFTPSVVLYHPTTIPLATDEPVYVESLVTRLVQKVGREAVLEAGASLVLLERGVPCVDLDSMRILQDVLDRDQLFCALAEHCLEVVGGKVSQAAVQRARQFLGGTVVGAEPSPPEVGITLVAVLPPEVEVAHATSEVAEPPPPETMAEPEVLDLDPDEVDFVQGFAEAGGRPGDLSWALNELLTRERTAARVLDVLGGKEPYALRYGVSALHALQRLPDECVDVGFTSPPYFGPRDYGDERQIGRESSREEHIEALQAVFQEFLRVLKPDGSLWVNYCDVLAGTKGGLTNPKRLDTRGMGAPLRAKMRMDDMFAEMMEGLGYVYRNKVAWCKGGLTSNIPQDRLGRLNFGWEPVFLFTRAGFSYFNGKSTYVKGQDVWSIPPERGQRWHGASFPVELPTRGIDLTCKPGGVVCDMFSGSATTGVAALAAGCRYIGFDIQALYEARAETRLQRALQEARLRGRITL